MTKPRKPSTRTNFYLPAAKLPPRFIADWFSDEAAGVKVSAETITAWRKAGFFGPYAKTAVGTYKFTWQELLTACGAWSPKGSLNGMQRKPYCSEVVAARLGLEYATTLDWFRKGKVKGGFQISIYWYARAAEFDAQV